MRRSASPSKKNKTTGVQVFENKKWWIVRDYSVTFPGVECNAIHHVAARGHKRAAQRVVLRAALYDGMAGAALRGITALVVDAVTKKSWKIRVCLRVHTIKARRA